MENFSNIITPPDFVDNKSTTITLIDPTPLELENLAFYLRTSANAYNVYAYSAEMKNQEWLDSAIKKSQILIINTVENEISSFKDKLVIDSETYYYGEKNFLTNQNRIEKPIDYFTRLG